ncbi:hypothetical protein SAMD00019534_048410, partial [Acytostelium subglobosum LB1]|uniref:hypothetical protein n=1 Tax=Acytostelium subglobosum LB1 TaxID=1410327 RepID=UPI0006447F38
LLVMMSTGRGASDLGNIDTCLGLPSNVSHYCIYQSSINNQYSYMIGVCFPPSCNTTDDLSAAIMMMASNAQILVFPGNNSVSQCYNNYNNVTVKSWTAGSIIMLCVCVFFAMIVLVGTALEYFKSPGESTSKSINFNQYNNMEKDSIPLMESYQRNIDMPSKSNDSNHTWSTFESIFVAFSLISNIKSFSRIVVPSSGNRFDALDGIRTFATCWVVLGHSLQYAMSPGMDNASYVFKEIYPRFTFQVIPSGEYAVDIFFMLSGFLVANTVLTQLDKLEDTGRSSGPIIWIKYIIHRFIRLSPLLYFLIFVVWLLSPMLGSGPLWYQSSINSGCSEYWWSNLLYINNLYPGVGQCMDWTWYLANDMQYYLLAPFVLVAFHKFKPAGYVFVMVILAVCFTSSIWIYMTFPMFTMTSGNSTDYLNKIYYKPWTRIGPYAVGLAVAMLYRSEKTKNMYDRRWFRYMAYLLAFGITSVFTYIPYFMIKRTPDQVWSAIINTLSHTLFTSALALFLMATFYGHGGSSIDVLGHAIIQVLLQTHLLYLSYASHCDTYLYVLSWYFVPLH